MEEDRYATQKYYRCRHCGRIFVGSLTGINECPDCLDRDIETIIPGELPQQPPKAG